MLKYHDDMKNPHLKTWVKSVSRLAGCGLILVLALGISFKLYNSSLEDTVFTNNYTTSVLYSDSLTVSSGAAPWALMTLNWFLARSALKRWWHFITKLFE